MVKTLPSRAGGEGSIPGWGAKILWPKIQSIKEKQYCKKFKRDFKNGPQGKNLKKKKKLKKEKKKESSYNDLMYIFPTSGLDFDSFSEPSFLNTC